MFTWVLCTCSVRASTVRCHLYHWQEFSSNYALSQVWPINHFPDVNINRASNELVNKHHRAFPNERILMQVIHYLQILRSQAVWALSRSLETIWQMKLLVLSVTNLWWIACGRVKPVVCFSASQGTHHPSDGGQLQLRRRRRSLLRVWLRAESLRAQLPIYVLWLLLCHTLSKRTSSEQISNLETRTESEWKSKYSCILC